MKRKDDAEERKETEKVLQKSMERTHWTTLSPNEANSDDPMTGSGNGNKIKFIVEYDNSASGINTVVSGSANAAVGRIQFGKKAAAVAAAEESAEESHGDSKTTKQQKIPKLK